MSDFQSQDPNAAPTAPPAPAAPTAPAAPAAQPYGSAPYGSAPAQSKFSVLAIVGFILAFVFSPAGIVVSAIALNQIKKTGDRGRPLALWGLILGIVFFVIWIGSVIGLIALAAANGGSYSYGY